MCTCLEECLPLQHQLAAQACRAALWAESRAAETVAGQVGEGWAAGEAMVGALVAVEGGGWEGAQEEGGWGVGWGALAGEGTGSMPRRGPPPPPLVAAWQARLQGGGEALKPGTMCGTTSCALCSPKEKLNHFQRPQDATAHHSTHWR